MSSATTPRVWGQNCIVACMRCRDRKLRCDDAAAGCHNCLKASVECAMIDPVSRREYTRRYLVDLKARIEHMRRLLDDSVSTPASQEGQEAEPSPGRPAYHGDGSVISVAKLVEAAVIARVTDVSLFDARHDVEREQGPATSLVASCATLPPFDTAEHLVESYLNGLHALHPVLREADVRSDLEAVYSPSATESATAARLFRLYMVFAIGSISLERSGSHPVSPIQYYATATYHVSNVFSLSGMAQLESIMLIILFSLQYDVGVGNKWDLTRMAMRICTENGFHLEPKRKDAKITMHEQMRRRLFWDCYISDRHSCSITGRPMAIEDRDITIKLPVDADDDLIEAGLVQEQSRRGPSAVSNQLRQIKLRQITSRIRAGVYQGRASSLDSALMEALSALDHWRSTFPIISTPCNVYETPEWRDLNYYRELLSLYRAVALPRGLKEPGTGSRFNIYLKPCMQAAMQVIRAYQALHVAEKLVMNWTCVHDVISAGFASLYCALVTFESCHSEGSMDDLLETKDTLLEAVSTCVQILGHIAKFWRTVDKHLRTFDALSKAVLKLIHEQPCFTSGSGSNEKASGMQSSVYAAPLANAISDQPLDSAEVEGLGWSLQSSDYDAGLLSGIDWDSVDWEAIMNSDGGMLDMDSIMTIGH